MLAGVAIVALLGPVGAPPPAPQQANAGTVPPGFEDTVAIAGLINPTVIRFASDGRVFIAEKRGVIKIYDTLSNTTPTVFADLRTDVYNFWDRGLLGMALDPNFPSNPYIYVLYSYDHELGSTSPPPRWGTPGTDSDPCPTPPGPNTDGCVISARLSRLMASGNTMTGSEKVLIEDWCQQYPSHSIGALQFGPDGELYVSAGDGASFTFTDYGQDGNPLNPCGDPPGGVGSALAPPTAEGGALRSQDLRTTEDPVTLDGAILRVDPSTGAAAPGNPLAANPDPNAQRIIAYGLRNPFRFAFRPGTSELWIGDVGWNTWEEIDRVMNPTDSVVENFGWPCYEGQARQASYDSANLNICENLYNTPSADIEPYFSYNHANPVVPGESCKTGSSSISGLSFEFSPPGGSFPDPYQRALFFADYSRNCIWAMKKDANGIPAPGLIETFDAGAAHPVDLEFGPGGALFYVDFDAGTIHRVAYVAGRPDLALGRPATASSSESSSLAPDKANDGDSTTRWSSSFADGQWWKVDLGSTNQVDTVSLNWEAAYASSYKVQVSTDGSTFTDAATVSNNAPGWKTTTFTPVSARYVRVLGVTRATQWGISFWDAQVFGGAGPANGPPTPVIDAPLPTLAWKVGDPISFSGHATDPEQGTLAASALSWTLLIHHCPSNCHTHTIQTWPGVASGSFNAPDHDHASWLELDLTATDAGGASATASVLLHPITVALTFASSPSGLQISVNGASVATPATLEKIVGSTNSMSATTPQVLNGTTYEFVSWSDGGAQTHNVTAPSSPATYTATYRVAPPTNTALPTISGSGPPREGRQLTVTNGTWTGSQPMTFTYQWSRCDSSGGACVDLAGATSKTYTPTSSDVGSRLRATVTATNAGGVASATSNPTSAIRSR